MKLIKGKIYTSTENNDIYVWRCSKNNSTHTDARLLVRKGENPKFATNVGVHGWEEYRESTLEEKSWLEACIEAKKIVPKPEILGFNYEIY